MERGWTKPGEMSKNTYDDDVPNNIFYCLVSLLV